MNMQAGNLRIYSLAYEEWQDPQYLKAAQDVQRFLKTFLTSPDGAFYTSMDADLIDGEHSAAYFKLDDAGRRKLGCSAHGQACLFARKRLGDRSGGDVVCGHGRRAVPGRSRARRAVDQQNRSLGAGGGFRHDTKDVAGPYLADTLAMGRAFLALYEVTGDRRWLAQAESPAKFIAANFSVGPAGFTTAKAPTDRAYTPRPERDENMLMARFGNQLARYTGNEAYRKMAERAMRYLVAPRSPSSCPPAEPCWPIWNSPPTRFTSLWSVTRTTRPHKRYSTQALPILRVICVWNGGTRAKDDCRIPTFNIRS